MALFSQFSNTSSTGAPFGFVPQPDPVQAAMGDYYNPKAAKMAFVGSALQGLGTGLMTRDWVKAAEVQNEGMNAFQDRAFKKYQLTQLAQEGESRKRDRERQAQLSSRWEQFAKSNAAKFGAYADLAPYLDPNDGMKILAGQQPDWRPATAEERASLGVGAGVPLVIGADGPRVLGGGGTTINMPAMESSYDKEIGGGLAKTMMQLQQDKGNAQSSLGAYDEMNAALEQPGVYTGLGGPTVRAAQQLGTALGITDPAVVANTEKFEAAANKAIKDEVGSLGAGVSEGDRRFVENANAGLTRTKLGNQMIIQMKRKVAERKIQMADFAQQYAMQNGGRLDAGFYSALGEWSASNPLFSPQEQKAILTESLKGRSTKPQAGGSAGEAPDVSGLSDDDLMKALEGN